MSAEKAGEEARRWFDTAHDDLLAAQVLCDNEKFAQSCFHCQQAAEKAMKAAYYACDADPWGHSVFKLVQGLDEAGIPSAGFSKLTDEAKRIDQYYIPTRYPNGLPGTIPSQAYSRSDAQWTLSAAQAFLDAASALLGSVQKPPT